MQKLRKNFTYFVVPILLLIFMSVYIMSGLINDFKEDIFSADKVYKHIVELSSPKYKGRLAGSEGNEAALNYVENYFKKLGIEPGGEKGTYYQEFDSMVPQIDEEPIFTIKNSREEIVEEFEMYKDYRLYTWGCSGGGSYEGDLLFVDTNLYTIDPNMLKGKLVVTSSHQLAERDLQYAINNGVVGILNYKIPGWREKTSKREKIKSVGRILKKGETIIFGTLSKKTYRKLKKYARENMEGKSLKGVEQGSVIGRIKNVKFKADLEFPIKTTKNILGKIEGRDKDSGYIIICAHIDHVGGGTNGKYFAGALDNASGVGLVMEMARVVKLQKNPPDKTIIFVGWNSEENGLNGSKYYVENPIYPLEKTQVINLDCIGAQDAKEIVFLCDERGSNILRNRLAQYADDLQFEYIEANMINGTDHQYFNMNKIPAVTFIDSNEEIIHTYRDIPENIDKEALKRGGEILNKYFKLEVFGDTFPDYFDSSEIFLISLYVLGLLFTYCIYILNKINPNYKLFKFTIEDIYYSICFNLIIKVYFYITPIIIIVFSLLFVSNLPHNFDLLINETGIHTNLSVYLTVKRSVLYLRSLLTNGFGVSDHNFNLNVIDVISNSFYKSAILLLFGIVISFVLGIFKGFYDSYKGRDNSQIRTFGTLVFFSLPDVLIVLVSILALIYVAKNEFLMSIIEPKSLRQFIVPLITLVIIPTVYISRIAFITIQEEKHKDYVMAAKAKGLSKNMIFIRHILISVVIKVIDSLNTLLSIIISNLIVVEFLFGYPGIVYNLLQYYKKDDTTTFIGLVIALGLIYVFFNIIFKVIGRFINPQKRVRVNK